MPNVFSYGPDKEHPFRKDWEEATSGGSAARYVPIHFLNVVQGLAANNGLSGTILDLGCGPRPISSIALYGKRIETSFSYDAKYRADVEKARREPQGGIVRVLADYEDLVHRLGGEPDSPLTVQMDFNCSDYSPLEAALDAAYQRQGDRGINAVIASAIMNYCDWKGMFARIEPHIRRGAILAVSNQVKMGPVSHEACPKSNREVFDFFSGNGYRFLLINHAEDMFFVAEKQ